MKNSLNKTASTISRKKKRPGTILFQLLIVIAFLALIWFSFGQNVLAPQQQAAVPERLGTLELVSSDEGSEAMGQISKLHGTDIILVEAYIIRYARSNEAATVWVGRAENSDAAAELTRQMAVGITSSNSVFSNLKRLSIAQGYHSHEVFQVDGPGGKHFFYQSREPRERIVWLSIQASDTMPILEQALEIF